MDGKKDGLLRGKEEVRRFLEAGARSRPIDLVRWHRSDTFFSEGDTLIWEYPRATPEGDQVEIVEVMQIAGRVDPVSPHLLGLERVSFDRPKIGLRPWLLNRVIA